MELETSQTKRVLANATLLTSIVEYTDLLTLINLVFFLLKTLADSHGRGPTQIKKNCKKEHEQVLMEKEDED